MLKVFGFVRRHPNLTHDEYRTGHVGYHNSFGRRLPNIRGYLLNVRANRSIEESLGGALLEQISKDEPDGFDDLWDGWGQLLFDSMDDYVGARSPARDRAGPEGLIMDPGVAGVGGDFNYLYGGSPFQFHVDEHIVVPVVRPERKQFKLAQFVKRPDALAPELFSAYLSGRYASYLAQTPGLNGLVVNLRTPIDVMTRFFQPDAEGFTPEGTALRERFHSYWDGIVEYWLDEPGCMVNARTTGPEVNRLLALESTLFAQKLLPRSGRDGGRVAQSGATTAFLPSLAPITIN